MDLGIYTLAADFERVILFLLGRCFVLLGKTIFLQQFGVV